MDERRNSLGEEPGSNSANEPATPAARRAAPLSTRAAMPQVVNDPKEYAEAPFSYKRTDSESVSLNSGALLYSVTDFAIPGKDGLDLVVKRRYNSAMSNAEDVNIEFEETEAFSFRIEVRYRFRGFDGTYRYTIETDPAPFFTQDAVEEAAQEEWDYWTWEYQLGGMYPELVEAAFGYDDYGSEYELAHVDVRPPVILQNSRADVQKTVTRPNDHATSLYHIGQGWSFGFASIEAVKDEQKISGKNRVLHSEFLHLADGRVYKTNLRNANGLDDDTVPDITLAFQSGSFSDYVLTHSNGTKEYLNVIDGTSTRCRLSAIVDRFGNRISFAYSGSRITITDTLGRAITFSGSIWSLPDGKTVSYSVNGSNQLASSTDQLGRVTRYSYSRVTADCNPLKEYGDEGVRLTYNNLTAITHPTGAKSEYTYARKTITYNDKHGEKDLYTVSSRKDTLPSGETKNSESYSYTYHDGYEEYIESARVTKANLIETHAFNSDGLRTSEIAITGSTTVVNKTFTYNGNKLMTQERMTAPFSKTSSWDYDAKGNVLKQTEAGFVTNMTYDFNSQPLTKSYSRGSGISVVESNIYGFGNRVAETRVTERGVLVQAVGLTYDGSGRVTAERHYANLSGGNPTASASDRVIRYAYEGGSLFPSKKSVDGTNAVEFQAAVYDSYGNTLQKQDGNGNRTVYTYDALGRLLTEQHADGTAKRNSYDDANNRVTQTDENGNQKRLEYTALGQISRVVDPSTNTVLTEVQYDGQCRASSETAYLGGDRLVTKYSYDYFDRPILKRQQNRLGAILYEETTAYNNAAITETKTVTGDGNAASIVTMVTKDVLGRVIRQAVGGNHETYAYDNLGNRLTATNARGARTAWEYDFAGRAVKETNALGKSASTAYDSLGNKTSATDFLGNRTSFAYDLAGRLTERLSPMSAGVQARTAYAYDGGGNVTDEYVADNLPGQAETLRRSSHQYDNRNRLRRTTLYDRGAVSVVTEYQYDGAGNKARVVTGSFATDYAYNRFGKVTRQTDAAGLSDVFAYDNYGMLTGKTDRNGDRIAYTYDALGRVLTETARDAATAYAYTMTGQKKTESNKNLTAAYYYDGLGRVSRVLESGGVEKAYSYDAANNRTGFALKNGSVSEISTTYEYDAGNRMTAVRENGAVIATYAYDDNGNRALMTNANGTSASYAYNAANLVTSLVNRKGSGVISSYAYEYRRDGNQAKKTDHSGKVTAYAYDGLGRLLEESENNGNKIAYTYDDNGNRATMTVTGADPRAAEYSYDANNRLLEEKTLRGKARELRHFTYDRAGNQLTMRFESFSPRGGVPGGMAFKKKSAVDFFQQRRYNGLGQVVNLFVDNAVTEYRYRPDGLRHSKTTAAVTTTHLWDGQNICAEIGVNDEVHSRYLRGVNLIARRQDGLNQYYHFNAHGDVVQRTDANGIALKNYDYDAFGVEREPEDMDANPFRYCGEYFDRESKDLYLRARYYNASTGRFSSEDIASSGHNWYAYGENNPVRYTDPMGLSVKDILYGLTESMDENLTGGFAKWFASKIRSGYFPNGWTGEAAKDYYTGRVIGGILSTLVGAGMAVKGVLDIIASIGAGATVTLGTGGIGAVGGVAISVAGVEVGALEAAYGVSVAVSAVGGLSQDWAMLSEILGNGGGDYYIKGLKDIPDDWVEVEAPEILKIKSESFKQFLRDNGFNPNKWNKVVERWASPDGTIYQRNYWTDGRNYYYHGAGIEEYFPH